MQKQPLKEKDNGFSNIFASGLHGCNLMRVPIASIEMTWECWGELEDPISWFLCGHSLGLFCQELFLSLGYRNFPRFTQILEVREITLQPRLSFTSQQQCIRERGLSGNKKSSTGHQRDTVKANPQCEGNTQTWTDLLQIPPYSGISFSQTNIIILVTFTGAFLVLAAK